MSKFKIETDKLPRWFLDCLDYYGIPTEIDEEKIGHEALKILFVLFEMYELWEKGYVDVVISYNKPPAFKATDILLKRLIEENK